jgi:hypothetical protein
MAHSIGVNDPFLRPPGPGAGEVRARGVAYGQKIRGENLSAMYWAYGRKTWGTAGGLTFPSSKQQVDSTGQISLYSPRTHIPKLPILTGIDTSNEGHMGSIIKASVSFTLLPSITQSGINLNAAVGGFFKPGSTIGVRFGWTTWAALQCASTFGFSGKVLSFSWSVNTDVSVNASTSMLSQGVIATGITGNLSKPAASGTGATPAPAPTGGTTTTTTGATNTFQPLDAKTIQAFSVDLGTTIDKAMAQLNPVPSAGSAGTGAPTVVGAAGTGTGVPEEIYGIKAWKTDGATTIDSLDFIAVGIPWQPEPPSQDEVTKFDESAVAAANGSAGSAGTAGTGGASGGGTGGAAGSAGTAGQITKPIVKKFWYVKFGSIETFLDPLVQSATKGQVVGVDINNQTNTAGSAYTSAYPMEVLWNGCDYGSGAVSLAQGTPYPAIGGIWFNCDYVKETWRSFFNEKSDGDATERNLKSFLNALAKRASEASGDFWQLSATVVEKISTCGGQGSKVSVLSVEDLSYCVFVSGFPFNASFARPMLKNVSISMQGSSAMGAAVMGGGNLDTVAEPGATHGSDPTGQIDNLKEQAKTNGINTAWGDAMKGLLKLKKKADAAHHSKRGILFPIDFNVTIDGCSGWGFCESINTNLKPPGYGGTTFSISGINNKIDNNTWETSLKGIMRMA